MKKIIYIFGMALLAATALASCGGTEESESGGGKVPFTVTPDAAKNETAFGHDLVFKVQASGEVQAVINDADWAVVSVGAPEGDITPVTVSLDANDGTQSRKCVLSISAGTQKAVVPIVQSTLSSMIGGSSEVSIKGAGDAVVTFKLSKDWTLSLSSTRGEPDWLDVSPKEGKGLERADVAFHPDFYNLSAESRDAYARITLSDGSFFFFHISQDPCLPTQDFLEKTAYGYYNYDGKGASVEFDALAHQSAVIRSTEGASFRLIWPAKERFFDFKGIPGQVAEKDFFDLKLVHCWTTSASQEEDHRVGVVKLTSELVYAIDDDKRGYIFKNMQ